MNKKKYKLRDKFSKKLNIIFEKNELLFTLEKKILIINFYLLLEIFSLYAKK
jgi:hypothetical protein